MNLSDMNLTDPAYLSFFMDKLTFNVAIMIVPLRVLAKQ